MHIETNVSEVLSKWQAQIKQYPKKAESAIRTSLFKVGTDLKTKATIYSPKKTGNLAQSIVMKPMALNLITDQVAVGTNKVYGRIQDLGGTIKPKNGSYLTIPIGNTKGRIRDYPDGFFIKSKSGKLLYMQKQGKSGMKPLFVLKKQVEIKGKPYLTRGFNEVKGQHFTRIVEGQLERAFDEKK